MTVAQSDPIDPTDNAARDLVEHETTRRVVWRLLLDLADSTADAVTTAGETVTAEELTLLAPASGELYALMLDVAADGQKPDAVTLLSAALAGGRLAGHSGDQLHRILLTLAGSSGEALRLPQSLRAVAALAVRARAAALGHALVENAATASEADLTATVARDASELLALMARLERCDRNCGVHIEPAADLVARKAAA